jgi:hypothetical protein
MMKEEVESLGHGIYKKLHGPKIQENMRKNMKIPRKKRSLNNQSLYQESQDYQPDMKAIKQN